jgi:hypothetical protein
MIRRNFNFFRVILSCESYLAVTQVQDITKVYRKIGIVDQGSHGT